MENTKPKLKKIIQDYLESVYHKLYETKLQFTLVEGSKQIYLHQNSYLLK